MTSSKQADAAPANLLQEEGAKASPFEHVNIHNDPPQGMDESQVPGGTGGHHEGDEGGMTEQQGQGGRGGMGEEQVQDSGVSGGREQGLGHTQGGDTSSGGGGQQGLGQSQGDDTYGSGGGQGLGQTQGGDISSSGGGQQGMGQDTTSSHGQRGLGQTQDTLSSDRGQQGPDQTQGEDTYSSGGGQQGLGQTQDQSLGGAQGQTRDREPSHYQAAPGVPATGYKDLIKVPVHVDSHLAEMSDEETEVEKGGPMKKITSVLGKVKKLRGDKDTAIGNVITLEMTREDYNKYWRKDEEGNYAGTEPEGEGRRLWADQLRSGKST